MINDEELKKIHSRAKRAIDDGHKGLTIVLAMDLVVMFALAGELLRLRILQRAFENAMDAGLKRSKDAVDERQRD
jgi:hypothetical protein